MRRSSGRRVVSQLVAGLALAWGCAHVPKRFPLPEEHVESAEDFTAESEGYVDTQYMKKLIAMAFDLAKAGYAWEKAPPQLDAESIRSN